MTESLHDFGHPTTQRLRGGCPEDVPGADLHHDLVEDSRPPSTPHASQSQPVFQPAIRRFDACADLIVLLERFGGLLPAALLVLD